MTEILRKDKARKMAPVHPGALNICDCCAYALAMDQGCPLLFVGDDFAKTDVAGVL